MVRAALVQFSGNESKEINIQKAEDLARQAAGQWTGTFNPRPFDARGALEIYEMAW